MEDIVESAWRLLNEGKDFVLATIVRQQGSAPRSAGTRMLVAEGQQIFGTIGGGLLEARVMQAAATLLQGQPSCILDVDLSNEDAAAMEMICGGEVQVLLDHIRSCKENRDLFSGWRRGLAQGRKVLWVTVLPQDALSGGVPLNPIRHCLITADGHVEGSWPLSAAARETLSQTARHAEHLQVQTVDGVMVVADPGFRPADLYIFGAGHVARPTSQLAAMVGFRVTVFDDRPAFAHPLRFPDAAAVHQLKDFHTALQGLPVGRDTHIVIVTRGHLHDRVVLAQALKSRAAYIGMIGSRHKREATYKQLLRQGFTQADFKRVHCPIGINIGGHTPAEIAVSIVAELIAVRAGHLPAAAR